MICVMNNFRWSTNTSTFSDIENKIRGEGSMVGTIKFNSWISYVFGFSDDDYFYKALICDYTNQHFEVMYEYFV